MPRKKRITIDPTEGNVTVATLLPVSVAEHIEHLARKKLSTNSQYVREAVLSRLEAEGHIAETDEAAA